MALRSASRVAPFPVAIIEPLMQMAVHEQIEKYAAPAVAVSLSETMEEPQDPHLRHKMPLSRRWTVVFLAVSLFVVVLVPTVRINTTPSVPLGIYFRMPKGTSIKRGDYVFACIAPGEKAQVGLERGYLEPGGWDCEVEMAPLVKRVVAVGGDTIRVDETGVYRNGIWVARPPVGVDSQGREMWVDYGTFPIPEGHYWLGSDEMGYDSRYLGVFSPDLILREAQPFLQIRAR